MHIPSGDRHELPQNSGGEEGEQFIEFLTPAVIQHCLAYNSLSPEIAIFLQFRQDTEQSCAEVDGLQGF